MLTQEQLDAGISSIEIELQKIEHDIDFYIWRAVNEGSDEGFVNNVYIEDYFNEETNIEIAMARINNLILDYNSNLKNYKLELIPNNPATYTRILITEIK